MPLDVRCSRCNAVKVSYEISLFETFWNAIKERYGEEESKDMESLYSQLEKDVSIEKPNPWTKNDKINILDPDVRESFQDL